MPQAALIVSSLLGDLPREVTRIAGAVVLLVLASVLVVVIAVAAMAATLLAAPPSVGGPEPPPPPPDHATATSGVRAASGVPGELPAAIAPVGGGSGARTEAPPAGAAPVPGRASHADAELMPIPLPVPAARGRMRHLAAFRDTNGIRKVFKALTEALQRELDDPRAAPAHETRELLAELLAREQGAVV